MKDKLLNSLLNTIKEQGITFDELISKASELYKGETTKAGEIKSVYLSTQTPVADIELNCGIVVSIPSTSIEFPSFDNYCTNGVRNEVFGDPVLNLSLAIDNKKLRVDGHNIKG